MRMKTSICLSLTAAALVLSLGTQSATGQGTEDLDGSPFAPDGWIRTQAWNLLFLDTDPTGGGLCDGGGPERMLENWLSPYVIGEKDPKGGDEWYIDFETAQSNAWELTGLGASPRWVTPDYMRMTFGGQCYQLDEDAPNFDAIVLQIADISGGSTPAGEGAINDGVMSIATTYVKNLTEAPLPVSMCTTSDDSIQLWVNNILVTNRSACRGTDVDCNERFPALLAPGVNKIAVLVWEGGGGFGMRVGIIGPNAERLSDGNPYVEFMGPGGPSVVGQIQEPYDLAAFGTYDTANGIPVAYWNILFGLQNRYGATNDLAVMDSNWLAPHRIGREDPKPGDVWDDIDFGGVSPSGGLWEGYLLGGLTDGPTWFSVPWLEAAVGLPVGTIRDPLERTVDFNDLTDRLRDIVIRQNFPGGASPYNDNVTSIVTTYVRNVTGAPLDLELVHNSDDSAQVWVNCQRVYNRTGCCWDVVTPITLPVGVSKIAAQIWEGAGGWNWRAFLRRPGGMGYPLTGTEGLVEFLGTGLGDDAAVTPIDDPCIDRDTTDNRECLVADALEVTLTGSPDAAGDVTVVETITSSAIDGVQFPAISENCVAADVIEAVYTNRSSTGVDMQWSGDFCNFTYAEVTGDFDVSVRIVDYSHSTGVGSWGKWGLMARENLNKCARMAISLRTGPGNPGDGGRDGYRVNSQPTWDDDLCTDLSYAEGDPIADVSRTPIAMRLKRVGDAITIYAADVVPTDPTDEAQWKAGRTLNFDPGLPDTILVGMANSEHGDGGADVQTIQYTILNGPPHVAQFVIGGIDNGGQSGWSGPDDTLVAKTITCTGAAAGFEAGYSVSAPPGESVTIAGTANGREVNTGSVTFRAGGTGPVGDFDASQPLGNGAGNLVQNGDGSYTLTMQGADFWAGGDDGYFAWQEVEGDFQATLHVSRRDTGFDDWGRQGIMARYTCARDSKYDLAFTVLPPEWDEPVRPRQYARFIHREAGTIQDLRIVGSNRVVTGEGTEAIVEEISPQPNWLRLTRRGNYIYSEFADDDENGDPRKWIFCSGTTDRFRPDRLLVGVAGTSHNADAPRDIEFDFWDVIPAPAFPDLETTVGDPVRSDDFEGDVTGLTVSGLNYVPTIVDVGGNKRLRVLDQWVWGAATAAFLDVDAASTGGPALGDSGFRVEFDMYYARDDLGNDVNPADGATFAVFQGRYYDIEVPFGGLSVPLGDAGGGLGFQQYASGDRPTQKRKSFAVEMDLWDGGYGSNDYTGTGAGSFGGWDGHWHTAVDFSQTLQSAMVSHEYGENALPNIFDPAGAHFEVIYIAPTNEIQVWVSGKESDGSDFPPTKVAELVGVDLEGDIYLGFTGGTGGATVAVDVDNVVVSPLSSKPPEPPALRVPLDIKPGGCPNPFLVGSKGVLPVAVLGTQDFDVRTVDPRSFTLTVGDLVGPSPVRWSYEDVATPVPVMDDPCYCEETGGDGIVDLVLMYDSSAVAAAFGLDSFPSRSMVLLTVEGKLLLSDDRVVGSDCIRIQLKGDVNADGRVDISDAIAVLDQLFKGAGGSVGSSVEVIDYNEDGRADVSDAIALLRYLF